MRGRGWEKAGSTCKGKPGCELSDLTIPKGCFQKHPDLYSHCSELLKAAGVAAPYSKLQRQMEPFQHPRVNRGPLWSPLEAPSVVEW